MRANARAIQYKFIVVNGQTRTSAFYKVVICLKFFLDIACQKLLKSANVS